MLDLCNGISLDFLDVLNYSALSCGYLSKAFCRNNFCASDYLSCGQNDCKAIILLFPLPSVS